MFKRSTRNQSIEGSLIQNQPINPINLRGYPSQSGLDRIDSLKPIQICIELRVKGGVEDAFVLFLVRAFIHKRGQRTPKTVVDSNLVVSPSFAIDYNRILITCPI